MRNEEINRAKGKEAERQVDIQKRQQEQERLLKTSKSKGESRSIMTKKDAKINVDFKMAEPKCFLKVNGPLRQ